MHSTPIPSMHTAKTLIEDMARVFKDPAVEDLDKRAALHNLSSDLLAVTTAMRMRTFSQAAFTCCGMLDRMRITRRWDSRSVAVFIEAFRRLHGADDNSPLAGNILEGLKRVADRADPLP